MKPRLLDLFCGGGGASCGYQRAGFHVTGVDHAPQPRYCGDELIQANALEYVEGHGSEFDAIHASPPCQGYSRMRHLPWLKGHVYPLLIDVTRQALRKTGALWVIENVEDAPLSGIVLCGHSLGLTVYRHRRFESNIVLLAPPHRKHAAVIGHGRMLNDRAQPNADGWVSLPSKGRGLQAWQDNGAMADGHCAWKRDAAREALGIDWMTKAELAQAIPPAYTEFLGRQILQALTTAREESAS